MMIPEKLNPHPTWDLGQTYQTFTKGTFHGVIMGVEIQKSDDDLLRYQEIVDISQPDIVIETGTRAGGSAVWFHRELQLQVIVSFEQTWRDERKRATYGFHLPFGEGSHRWGVRQDIFAA